MLVSHTCLQVSLLPFSNMIIVGVELLGTVPIDLSNVDIERFNQKIVKGRTLYDLIYTLEVQMGAKEGVLCFRVLCNGEKIGETQMEYARE
jgi:hypothetical protein